MRQAKARTVISSGIGEVNARVLEERGVNFDFQYVSDSLWNLKSAK